MKKHILFLLLALSLMSCAVTKSKDNNKYELHFISNEWFLDKYKTNNSNPLNIMVTVIKNRPNTFHVNMKLLGVPLSGMNKNSFNIFSYCVYSYVTRKNKQEAWVFGGRKEENSTSIRNMILEIGSNEHLKTMKKDKSYKWLKTPVNNSSMLEVCERIFNDKFNR